MGSFDFFHFALLARESVRSGSLFFSSLRYLLGRPAYSFTPPNALPPHCILRIWETSSTPVSVHVSSHLLICAASACFWDLSFQSFIYIWVLALSLFSPNFLSFMSCSYLYRVPHRTALAAYRQIDQSIIRSRFRLVTSAIFCACVPCASAIQAEQHLKGSIGPWPCTE